jgi:hypothetical protein
MLWYQINCKRVTRLFELESEAWRVLLSWSWYITAWNVNYCLKKINGTAIANPWDEKDLILASSRLVRRSDRAQELLDPRSAGYFAYFL